MIDVFADPSICTCLHRCIPCLAPCAHASSCRRRRLNPCYTSKHPSQSQRGCKHLYTYPAAPECIIIYPSTFPACKGCAARASLVPDDVSPTMCPQKCVPNNVSPTTCPQCFLQTQPLVQPGASSAGTPRTPNFSHASVIHKETPWY